MKSIERYVNTASVSSIALVIFTLVVFWLSPAGETQPQATATATATGTTTASATSTPESPVGHHQHHINEQTYNSITVNFTYSLGYDKLDCIFVQFVNSDGEWVSNEKYDRSELIRISDTQFRITFSHLLANRAYTYRIVVQERPSAETPTPHSIVQYTSPPRVAWTRPQPIIVFADETARSAYRETATAQGTEVGPLRTSTFYPETGAQEKWLPGTPTPDLPVRAPNDSSSGSNLRPASTPRPADGPLKVGEVCGSFEHGHFEGIFLNGTKIPLDNWGDYPEARARYGPSHSHPQHVQPGGYCAENPSDRHDENWS